METRVAVVSIIIEAGSDVEKVNALLHEFAPYILGRMGIPYRRRAINIISVAMEAPQDAVPPHLGLPKCWDYRCEPLHLAPILYDADKSQ